MRPAGGMDEWVSEEKHRLFTSEIERNQIKQTLWLFEKLQNLFFLPPGWSYQKASKRIEIGSNRTAEL